MIGFKQSSERIEATKIVALLVFILIGGGCLYTQLVASAFGYSATLGPAVYKHMYWPWKGFVWLQQAGGDYQALFHKEAMLSAAITSLVFGFSLFYLVSNNAVSRGNKSLYGTASFASYKDVQATGLIKKDNVPSSSVVVGGYRRWWNTKILYHDGPEHVIGFAPSRSGKGVCLLLPTLYTWTESILMLDVKGEGFALSSGWRKRYGGNLILRFDPTAEKGTGGAYFNPSPRLEGIPKGPLPIVRSSPT